VDFFSLVFNFNIAILAQDINNTIFFKKSQLSRIYNVEKLPLLAVLKFHVFLFEFGDMLLTPYNTKFKEKYYQLMMNSTTTGNQASLVIKRVMPNIIRTKSIILAILTAGLLLSSICFSNNLKFIIFKIDFY
jgi:hypothetical protein